MRNKLISDTTRETYKNANYGKPFPEHRRVGKSTAQAMGALAVALNEPRKAIRIHDHWGTEAADAHQAQIIRDIVDKLGLLYVIVFSVDGKYFVQSNHVEK